MLQINLIHYTYLKCFVISEGQKFKPIFYLLFKYYLIFKIALFMQKCFLWIVSILNARVCKNFYTFQRKKRKRKYYQIRIIH